MAMNVNTGIFVVDAGMTGLLDDFDVLLLNIANECSLDLREELEVMESAEEREMLAVAGSCAVCQMCAQESIKQHLHPILSLRSVIRPPSHSM